MPSAVMTSKGQVTIPKEVRDSLGIKPGSRLAFHLRDDGVVEVQPETLDVLSLCGTIKPKIRGITIEQMNTAIRKAGARR